MTTAAGLYEELLDRYGQEIADAFAKALQDLRDAADLQRLITALDNDDVDGALDALHIDPAAYNDVLDRIRDAHTEGGKATAASFPRRRPDGTALTIRFDARNLVAESWLRDHSSEFVTRITADQREAVRASLRDSIEQGVNPRTAGLRVVGTINRETGKRAGGILGLTAPQEQFVRSARGELASADPEGLRNYLTRARRSKVFDRSVRRALRDGTAVPASIAAKAVAAYSNRLLLLRGETIGKMETFDALAAAKYEAYRQAIESGKIDAAAVTKNWNHFPSEHPRLQHVAMAGKRAGFNDDFVLPDGTLMRFAHDPAAPVKHKAGCKCQTDYRIDFLADIR